MKAAWLTAAACVAVLAGCGGPAFESNADLVKKLQEGEREQRLLAAKTLSERGPNASDSALDIVQVVIQEEDHEIRFAAASALTNILEPGQLNAMLQQEVDPKDWWRFTENMAPPNAQATAQP